MCSPNSESGMKSHGIIHPCHSALALAITWFIPLGLDFSICIMGWWTVWSTQHWNSSILSGALTLGPPRDERAPVTEPVFLGSDPGSFVSGEFKLFSET